MKNFATVFAVIDACDLGCEVDTNAASGKASGQHRRAGPKSLSDLRTSQPRGTME